MGKALKVAVIGQRMAHETGVDVTVSAHTERETGLAGADFVICSAARDMQRRFVMDVGIIGRLIPGHLVTEFGGVQGLSYSFRQMALIEEIAADIKRLAPYSPGLRLTLTEASFHCSLAAPNRMLKSVR